LIASFAGLLMLYSGVAAFCQPLPHQLATPTSLPSRELIVATKEAPPFAMKGPDGRWQGISIDLWRRTADQLH
jgi:ABC-type amino acid transport substrate-binding protein